MLRYIYRILKKLGFLLFLENIRFFSFKIEKHAIISLKRKCFITLFFGTFGGISMLIRNYYINIDKRVFMCNYTKKLKDFNFNNKWFDYNLDSVLVLSILESILLESDSIKNSTIEYRDLLTNEKYVCIKSKASKNSLIINKAGGFFHFYLEVMPKLLKYVNNAINLYFIIEDKSFYKSILNFYNIKYDEFVPNLSGNHEIVKMNKYYPSIMEIRKFKQDNEAFKVIESSPKKIYITRKNERARRIANEQSIIKYLTNFDFEVIDPGTFDFADQISYFRNADIIVSPHGAALSNIIWCKQNVKIIELNGDQDVRWHFAKVAFALNLDHTLILGKTIDNVYFETNIASLDKILLEINKN